MRVRKNSDMSERMTPMIRSTQMMPMLFLTTEARIFGCFRVRGAVALMRASPMKKVKPLVMMRQQRV